MGSQTIKAKLLESTRDELDMVVNILWYMNVHLHRQFNPSQLCGAIIASLIKRVYCAVNIMKMALITSTRLLVSIFHSTTNNNTRISE